MALTDGIEIPLGNLKQQLKEAQKEVQVLADKFGLTSEQAIKAAKKAAELKDRIGDAKALTEAYNPDAKFKAVTSSLAGIAGGFSAVQGVMGLFGAETKDVEKALLKVQSAMAITQGIDAVTNSIDSFKTLGNMMNKIPIVQKAITGAQWLWNAAMSANPVGAVVAVVTALIAGITALVMWLKKSSDTAKEQAKSVSDLNKELKKQKEHLSDSAIAFDRDQKHRLAMAKATGQSAAAIRELERKLIDEKIAFAESSAQAAYNTLVKQKNALATLKAAGAEDELIKKQQENVDTAKSQLDTANADVKKAGNEKKDLLNRQQEEIAQQQTDANKAGISKQKEYNDKVKEQQEAANEELKKIAFELEKNGLDARGKELLDLKDNYEKRKKILTDGHKSTAELDKLYKQQQDQINDKYNKEDAKKQADYQKELEKTKTDIRLAAITDENEKAKEQIKINYEQQFKDIEANENYSAEQKIELKKVLQQKEDDELNRLKVSNAEKTQQQLNDIETKNTDLKLEYQRTTAKTAEEKRLAEIAQVEEDYNRKIALAKKNGEDTVYLELLKTNKIADINKIAADNDKKIKQAKIASDIDLANQTLNVLAGIVDKNSAAGKGIAVAQAVINTYQAASKAFAQGGVLGPVLGAVTIAAGLLNVKKIISTKVPSAKGSGSIGDTGGVSAPSMSSAAPITPSAPQAQMTQLDQTSINALGNQAIKAYVVETDMTTSQQRIKAIQQRARFG